MAIMRIIKKDVIALGTDAPAAALTDYSQIDVEPSSSGVFR